MAYATDDPAERERRRWIKPNAYFWVRPDIHRFMRPDAERFFHPSHKGQKPWYEQPEYMSPAMRVYAETPASPYGPDDPTARADASAAEADRRAFEAELEQLRADHAELRRQVLAHRQALALSRLTRKADFDPNQPRVPAGNPDGGRWIGEGGGSAASIAGGGSGDDSRAADIAELTGGLSDRTLIGKEAQPAPYLLAVYKGGDAAYCWNQMRVDMLYCSALTPAWRNAACRAQANERYSACLAGKPLPPLPF